MNAEPTLLPEAVSLPNAPTNTTSPLTDIDPLVAGVVVGSADQIEGVRRLLNELGGSLDPHACFLLNRGLKTLVLRVCQQNESALELVRRLAKRDDVERVNYPGLESHPDHVRALELFDGFGGMFSFELAGGPKRARRFLDRLELPTEGPSLGGVETLVTRPAATSHAGLSREDRARLGIGDSLIRVSVGIESIDDLISHFEQALSE